MTSTPATIFVVYTSIDRVYLTRRFKTLVGAQRFAQKYIGATPELGFGYAVSGDGIGKITCQGCSLRELFPALGPTEAEIEAQQQADIEAELQAQLEADRAYYAAEEAKWAKAFAVRRSPGCICTDAQLHHVGCECGSEYAFACPLCGQHITDGKPCGCGAR